ncbi:MAG: DUF3426 domain-containing protein [Steroidobacteraceae bacterium]
MLTQCPECQTTFRITPAILRAASGQVRCGRCRTQFDATMRLLDDEGLPLAPGEPVSAAREPIAPPAPERSENIVVEEPPAQEDITLEGQRIEITGTYRVLHGDSHNPDVAEEVVREVHVFEGAPGETVAESDADTPPFESSARFLARRVAEEDEALLREAERRLDASDEEAAQLVSTPVTAQSPPPAAPIEHELDLLNTSKPRKPAPKLWKVALVPLVLLLIIQIVHHERAQLARHPRVGPWLSNVYSAFGMQLDPDWDLSAYDIKQRGVMADPATPGTLTVRATITNRASYPQPYPLLKLVLEDRWGSAVRAREFRPDEYASSTPNSGLLAPNQKAEARVAIADPGPEAEGFRFDLCLKRTAGVVCAEEAP